MLRKIFLVLITVTPLFTRAQVNEDEAMAAFLLAEEFYAKSDYTSSLGFIEKAKKSFGGGNCKIYYLEVLIRNEIYRSNKNQYEPLMAAIRAFQSSKDLETFNREKVIEVIKLKMLLSQEVENKKMADSMAEAEKIKKEQLWERVQFRGWPLNVKFNDLMVMKVSHPFFKGKRDTHKLKDHPRVYYMINNAVTPYGKNIETTSFAISPSTLDSVAVIGVDNGIIKSYHRLKFSRDAFGKDAFTEAQAEQYISNIIDKSSRDFGFPPVKKGKTYTWTKNNKSYIIDCSMYVYKKTVSLTMQEIIISHLQ